MFLQIIIPTYNRSKSLDITLKSMSEVDCSKSKVEYIVINNNCTDDTNNIAEKYRNKLSLALLQEEKPGKNCALNKYLQEGKLGDVIVFTDDDVSPNRDWLIEIVESTISYPDISVFGGRIDPEWPDGKGTPEFLDNEWILGMGFSKHDLGDQVIEYPKGKYPFGPNFWVRSEVFNNSRKFNELIGPKGKGRIMGSETSFLMDLERDGYKMMYIPNACVRHRIKHKDIEYDTLKKRAISMGRGAAHLHGINYNSLLTKSPLRWYAKEYLKIGFGYLNLLKSSLHFNKAQKLRSALQSHVDIARSKEALTLAPGFTKD